MQTNISNLNQNTLMDSYFELMGIPNQKRNEESTKVSQMPWFNLNEPIKEFSLLTDVDFSTSTSISIS